MDRASSETKLLRGALRHDIVRALFIVNASALLARVVGPVGRKRALQEGGFAIGYWSIHCHVRGDGREDQGRSHEQRFGGMHADVLRAGRRGDQYRE